MNEAKSPRRASERPVTALPACFAFYIIASSKESRILLLLLTNPTSHIICALSSSNTRSKAANVLSIHKGHVMPSHYFGRTKKKLMWADWVKDALPLFNENCAWDNNSKVLGLFISKVIFSGIDYVQDLSDMVRWPTDIYYSKKGYTSSLWSKENTESDILQN